MSRADRREWAVLALCVLLMVWWNVLKLQEVL